MAETTKHSFPVQIDVDHSGSYEKKLSLATSGKYVDRDIEVTTSVSVPKSTTSIKGDAVTVSTGYVDEAISTKVTAGALNNAATDGITYKEETGGNTVIPAGGSLYINEGYYPNTKITLGQLIPDDENLSNAGNGNILKGYEAYDTNGNKLVGTIETITPTFTGGGVTATVGGSVTTTPNVEVTASGTLPSASSYGVTTTKPTTGTDGTNYLSIDGSGSATAGTVHATADASSAKVTYSKATTGYVNKTSGTQALAGQTATQKTKDVTVTPTVTDSFGAYYIPVTSVSHSGGTVTATADGSVTTAPSATGSVIGTVTNAAGVSTSKPTGTDGTDYLTISPSISKADGTVQATADASSTDVTYTNSAGAIVAHSGTTAVAGKTATQKTKDVTVVPSTSTGNTYYMSKSTVGSTASVTKAPKVTVSGSTNDTMVTSASATSYYVTVSGKPENGTATSYKTATAGYTPEVTSTSGGTATITPTVSGSGDKVYIQAGAKAASVSAHTVVNPQLTSTTNVSISSSTYSSDGVKSAAPTGKPYLTISPSASVTTAGSSKTTAKATIGTAGYMPADSTGVTSSESSKSVSVDITAGTTRYIEVYDGAYTIA